MASQEILERMCKWTLYVYSYAILVLAFGMTLFSLVLYLLSRDTVDATTHSCHSSPLVSNETTCGTCVGPSQKKACASLVVFTVMTLIGLILWALYLMKRCYKPGYFFYWKSR